ncbi:hypothetical protein C922_00280 [Plasmodium inui San Antonio 1]|uniref:Uncharacterized protein n=1 Tax=Plasmodium inui San Antonio 1 TaxID=1237626 RepID=W7A875_9APIC|nr:hypothetical protein C922_00280 [Plasmodium inui San Antonio 1]EUD69417.1 hypothetical protein C922_00280 [Plasmodium inui San Antonio 1]
MGGSIFAGYIASVLDASSRKLGCNTKNGESNGICDIITAESNRKIEGLLTYPKQDDEEFASNAERVYKSTRGICQGLEAWFTTKEINRKHSPPHLTGKCNYEEYKNTAQSSGGNNCQPRADLLNWGAAQFETELSRNYKEMRGLAICMNIVTIILISFGLTDTSKNVNLEKAKQGNYCEKTYVRLKNWTNDLIAKELMNQWFTVQGMPRDIRKEYEISGQDLFEAVSIANLSRGTPEKGLNCKYVGGQQTPHGEVTKVFMTVDSQDTTQEGSINNGEADRGTDLATSHTAGRPAGDSEAKHTVHGDNSLSPSYGATDSSSRENVDQGSGASFWPIISGSLISLVMGALGIYGILRIYRGRGSYRGGREMYARRRRGLLYGVKHG